MIRLRAFYKGDIRFNSAPIFEYNPTTNRFEMLKDREFAHTPDVLAEDNDWVVFELNDETGDITLVRHFTWPHAYGQSTEASQGESKEI